MSIKKSNELKQLKTRKSKISMDIDALQARKEEVSGELNIKSNQLKKIISEIEKLTSDKKIIVSEHAMLRYIERIIGIDLEDIKGRILPKKIRDNGIGNGKYPVGYFHIVVKDNTVVTIEN